MIRFKFPAVLALTAVLSGALMSSFGVANAAAKRDPKTGRFMKSTTTKMAPKATPKPKKTSKVAPKTKTKKTKKTMPARDPKTGRFMKKTAAPTPAKM